MRMGLMLDRNSHNLSASINRITLTWAEGGDSTLSGTGKAALDSWLAGNSGGFLPIRKEPRGPDADAGISSRPIRAYLGSQLIGGCRRKSDPDPIRLSVQAAVANRSIRHKALAINVNGGARRDSFPGFDTDARFGDIEQGSCNIVSSIDAQLHFAARSNASLSAVLKGHRRTYRTFSSKP